MDVSQENQEIRGFRIGNEMVCPNCVGFEETAKGDILTKDSLQEETVCDRCGKEL